MRARSCRSLLLALVAWIALPSASPAALEVLSPDSVTERFIEQSGSALTLRVDGRAWELITDPLDPALSNLGDGRFHPMNAALVADAVAMVEPLTSSLNGRVLILPYPRRNNLKSSCEGELVLLSPGILEVAPEHVHSTTIHELGHLFQRTHAPEGSSEWEAYLSLRGLQDGRFSADASLHRDRPREIFAEDFRFLFGSELATASGTIENPDLPLPTLVPGLREWFEELSRRPLPEAPESSSLGGGAIPNPFRRGESSAITFAMNESQSFRTGEGSSTAWVLDLSGRRVRELASAGSHSRFVWDGKSDAAIDVSSGVYFVRWLNDPQVEPVRVVMLR